MEFATRNEYIAYISMWRVDLRSWVNTATLADTFQERNSFRRELLRTIDMFMSELLRIDVTTTDDKEILNLIHLDDVIDTYDTDSNEEKKEV